MDQLYYELLDTIYNFLENVNKNKLAYIYPNLFLERRINEKKHIYRIEINEESSDGYLNTSFFRCSSILQSFNTLKRHFRDVQDIAIKNMYEETEETQNNLILFKKRLNNFNFKYTINDKMINIDGIQCVDTNEYFKLYDAMTIFIDIYSTHKYMIVIYEDEILNLTIDKNKNILNKKIEYYGLRFYDKTKNVHFCCQNIDDIVSKLKLNKDNIKNNIGYYIKRNNDSIIHIDQPIRYDIDNVCKFIDKYSTINEFVEIYYEHIIIYKTYINDNFELELELFQDISYINDHFHKRII
jgi:hypothetical protein